MADIAILVAEEYERRVKISRKSGEDIEFLTCLGVLGKTLKGYSSSLIRDNYVKAIKGHQNLFKILAIEEPKSPMSLAATYGFFSA